MIRTAYLSDIAWVCPVRPADVVAKKPDRRRGAKTVKCMMETENIEIESQ